MSFSGGSQKGVERLIRRDLASVREYSSLKSMQELSERAQVTIEEIVKLDGNENPYGCSPRVKKAMANYSYYHYYPDPEQYELRKALEGYVGLGAEHIVVGAGSDELIDLLLRLLIEPGDKVINCVPSFGMYSFSTTVCGGVVTEVQRDISYSVDVASVKAAVDERTKMIFVASPNNPSGNVTTKKDILELVDSGIMVVVDEAYFEFCGDTVAPLVPGYQNLAVLRTFSKWAGLAGLRVGYGLLPVKVAEIILKIKSPYNVNVAAQVAALESLADIGYLQSKVKDIVKERERLFGLLKELKFLRPLPSKGNYILCTFSKGSAPEMHKRLQQRGISVRYFDTPRLQNCLRISVGKPEHTDALIEALRELGEGGDG